MISCSQGDIASIGKYSASIAQRERIAVTNDTGWICQQMNIS